MANQNARKDDSSVSSLLAVNASATTETLAIYGNAATHGLHVYVAGSSTGSTWTRTTVTPSVSSQALIAANTNRKGLRIVFTPVTMGNTLYFSPGTSSPTSYFDSLNGVGVLELWDVNNPYTGAWTVYGSVADGTIQVWELA